MAHAEDGLTVFVPFAAPGDRLRARVIDRRRRFARAEITELLEPGKGRVEPRCGVFGRCGGCAWQHLHYDTQLQAKQTIIQDAIERIAGLNPPGKIPITASPDEYGYRIRARLLARSGQFGYRARSSHTLCAVSKCPVLTPPLEAELARLNSGESDFQTPAASHGESEWEMLADAAGIARSTRLASRPSGSMERVGPVSVLKIGSQSLSISPGSFVQANGLLHDALYRSVLHEVGEGNRVLEIHAGAGFFTLGLVTRFDYVEAVESSPQAASDLKQNLSRWLGGPLRILVDRAESVVPEKIAETPDVVLVDPPRTGLSTRLLEGVAGLAPDRIVYLSCDPATLARDLARFCQRGYRIRSLAGFDLFPQTPHVEILASLTSEV